MTYILVIYIYAGMLARGDSVALATVPGFTSAASCEAAGKETEKLGLGSAKVVRTVCLAQKL